MYSKRIEHKISPMTTLVPNYCTNHFQLSWSTLVRVSIWIAICNRYTNYCTNHFGFISNHLLCGFCHEYFLYFFIIRGQFTCILTQFSRMITSVPNYCTNHFGSSWKSPVAWALFRNPSIFKGLDLSWNIKLVLFNCPPPWWEW